MRIAGSSFSFYPSSASLSTGGNCAGAIDNRSARGMPFTLNITQDQDEEGWPYLRLGLPSGDLVLEKCRTCK